jgi:hypothetical protein
MVTLGKINVKQRMSPKDVLEIRTAATDVLDCASIAGHQGIWSIAARLAETGSVLLAFANAASGDVDVAEVALSTRGMGAVMAAARRREDGLLSFELQAKKLCRRAVEIVESYLDIG